MIKISFSIIVFNAIKTLPKNMLKLCIENVLPFAHEIIIAEGATNVTNTAHHYWDGDTSHFTNDGNSNDGTIQLIKELQLIHDNIKLIHHNGYWNGKTEMCDAIAKQATGDYLFQIDSDEFYTHEAMNKIINLLETKSPDEVHFFANHFFGGFDYCVDERSDGQWGNGKNEWRRIFRNIPNKLRCITHEPPKYICDNKIHDEYKIITKYETLKLGIKLFHYSCVLESQIEFKTKFFRNENYIHYWNDFKTNKSIKPFGANVWKLNENHPQIIIDNYLI